MVPVTCQDALVAYLCDYGPRVCEEHCELNFDECDSQRCISGDLCVERANNDHCICIVIGFTGTEVEGG